MGANSASLVSADDLTLTLLDINDLARCYQHIEPLLKSACEFSQGECTPQSVLAGMGLNDGVVSMQMLALIRPSGPQAIMVVQLSRTPRGRLLLDCLITSGSDVSAWLPFEPQMDEWARGWGCDGVRVKRARRGWLKALPHWPVVGIWLTPPEEADSFAPVCVPNLGRGLTSTTRALCEMLPGWKPEWFMLEREI